jgi:sugar lactone lactonase YvrE
MKLYFIETSGNVTPVPDDDRLVTPWGIAVEPSGAILVVDRVTQRLRRIGTDGVVVDVADVNAPRSILFDQQGRIVVLTDRGLVRIGEDGATDPWVKDAPFEFPHDAVMHPNGNVYVTDGYARPSGGDSKAGEPRQGNPPELPGLALDKGTSSWPMPMPRRCSASTSKEIGILAR